LGFPLLAGIPSERVEETEREKERGKRVKESQGDLAARQPMAMPVTSGA
jgi:hypothetical protein